MLEQLGRAAPGAGPGSALPLVDITVELPLREEPLAAEVEAEVEVVPEHAAARTEVHAEAPDREEVRGDGTWTLLA